MDPRPTQYEVDTYQEEIISEYVGDAHVVIQRALRKAFPDAVVYVTTGDNVCELDDENSIMFDVGVILADVIEIKEEDE